MNYYKQIAEMLGVELEEEFSLKNKDGAVLSKNYKISSIAGLLLKCDCKWNQSGYIDEIISGRLIIVKLPWKPKVWEQYFYCSTPSNPIAVSSTWTCSTDDYCKWKAGNCFKTKEEAETKGKEIMIAIQEEFEEA